MTLGAFLEAALTFTALTHGSVASWIRTPQRNRLVDGVRHSAHLVGLAVDVVYDDGPPSVAERHEWGARLGLRVIVEDDHDHVQPLDWPAG